MVRLVRREEKAARSQESLEVVLMADICCWSVLVSFILVVGFLYKWFRERSERDNQDEITGFTSINLRD